MPKNIFVTPEERAKIESAIGAPLIDCYAALMAQAAKRRDFLVQNIRSACDYLDRITVGEEEEDPVTIRNRRTGYLTMMRGNLEEAIEADDDAARFAVLYENEERREKVLATQGHPAA